MAPQESQGAAEAARAGDLPHPDAGEVGPVPGTGTGLSREVGRMADGRRITYYSLPASPAPPTAGADA